MTEVLWKTLSPTTGVDHITVAVVGTILYRHKLRIETAMIAVKAPFNSLPPVNE